MKIRRLAILDFYDVWKRDHAHHISGVTGMIGESLGAALLLHKLRRDGSNAHIVAGTPTTGTKGSKWLDCWIAVQKGPTSKIYQVEIKNWSAYSKGGDDLVLNATEDVYETYAIRKWASIFRGDEIRPEEVKKVLIRMQVPKDYISWEHHALACFWFCLHPQGKREHLFSVPVSNTGTQFQQIEIFSMSAYLRSLPDEDIEVDMPFIDNRLGLIRSILG